MNLAELLHDPENYFHFDNGMLLLNSDHPALVFGVEKKLTGVRICLNCLGWRDNHAEGWCLFQPTQYLEDVVLVNQNQSRQMPTSRSIIRLDMKNWLAARESGAMGSLR